MYLGLGANLGDRLANLERAVQLLGRVDGLRLVRSSRVYETDPVGPPQPEYLNAVIQGRTSLEPMSLLSACLSVEREMGRVRRGRWGPRIIDIDVLTYGDRVVRESELTIPHPRMLERAFVLVPLLEVNPFPQLPGGGSIGPLRLSREGVSVFAPPLPLPPRGGDAPIGAADHRGYTRPDR